MPFDVLNTVSIIELMENFLQRIRPPEEIRKQLDINYRIENYSIYLFTIRPAPFKGGGNKEYNYAKTTYIKKNDCWNIYWMKGDLKWHIYTHTPTAKTLAEAVKIIEANLHGKFDA